MLRVPLFALVFFGNCLISNALDIRGPERTVELADQVLHEMITIPMRQIPQHLLAEAQGIAIIPGVIKLGFVGGIRRGRGVVLVRGREGAWGLPQFATVTGGSVGWQAGIQATDVVFVFRTKQSVEGLLNGKLTLGVGGSLAAGPIGRSAEAATDAQLKAEILSYSRSRGIFAGVALDGSAIEIDRDSHFAFYGSPSNAPPTKVPESAMRLLADVVSLTGGNGTAGQRSLPLAVNAATPEEPRDLRKELAEQRVRLFALLSAQWQQYLALPPEVFSGAQPPSPDTLRIALEQFDRVAADGNYRGLTQRAEFQATHQALRDYINELSAVPTLPLQLPPPPGIRESTPDR
jgi:SH3 domain-containing YSC84-like protein 1